MVDCKIGTFTRAYSSPVLYLFDRRENRVDKMSEFETTHISCTVSFVELELPAW